MKGVVLDDQTNALPARKVPAFSAAEKAARLFRKFEEKKRPPDGS
jgi:hypothetical protein